ncbi:MAG: glycosyltransferase [Candidatus Fermentibacteraceae bacterium]|nr:glycosyltransferase [Candidatus Fermentibacteraceae bacterium]MBN2608959.1 glycosyltransferase [Candidatus Fermentibacteraceae bacterium]
MRSPVISVLIPFRDAAEYMDSALGSVAAQTFGDIEVVMVDDGSKDGSGVIARKWCGRDARFRLADCCGRGLVDALNSGLSACRGAWVARMDADDVCLPERLRLQLELAERSGVRTVVTCRVRSFPEDRVTDGYRAYEEWLNRLLDPEDIRRNIFVESPVPHPTAFYHRESIMAEGGYSERQLPEDYELWLRLWSRGYSFERVPEVLLMWRERPDRLSRRCGVYSLTNFYRLKARYLALVPCMSGRRVFIAGGGQTARRIGKCLQDNGFSIEAFLEPVSGGPERMLRGRPVLDPGVLAENSGIPVVIASRLPGARDSIRAYLLGLGLREWEDFVACS